MKLQYSYVSQQDENSTSTSTSPPNDIGKGLYSSVKTNTDTFPANITPTADTYATYYFDTKAVPGYTRLGNSTQNNGCYF